MYTKEEKKMCASLTDPYQITLHSNTLNEKYVVFWGDIYRAIDSKRTKNRYMEQQGTKCIKRSTFDLLAI